MAKSGNLSIDSENIFPIIKKWLYSDHDIFYRELISNGCDAIAKLKNLALIGEYDEPDDMEYKIMVTVNPTEKKATVTDNGLGMTEDEVDQYINQIAFSGAQDFLEKYKDKANEDQIIGHFGLGFYSAFMVADRVTIDTLSYQKDAKPVHWESEEGVSFEMSDGDRDTVGTTVTLYFNDDSVEFANEFRAREVIEKYCGFMPVEIYLEDETAEPQYEEIEKDELTDKDTVIETVNVEAETEEVEKDDGTTETVEVSPAREKYKILRRPKPVNDTNPLWNKMPNECTDEEYKEFYRNVFHDYREPLFWIHLNMDYPFNLKGILYFPRINLEYDSADGVIKLYNNQVFVADNIKEVIPEFLMVLKGVIDCPDLPLNVSRSALQNDGYVSRISDYITKKVADKLTGMYKTDLENYEKYWDDISPFVKYGCLKDDKFEEKMNDCVIFKDLSDKYVTLPEYLDTAKEKGHENVVYYVTNEKEQSQYINMFKDEGLDAIMLPYQIDAPFMEQLEEKNEGLKFMRIDAELQDSFKADEEEKDDAAKEKEQQDADALTALFRKALGNDELKVSVEKLKDESMASMITVSEDSRRMSEMMAMYGMSADMFPADETLILNPANSLVQYVLANPEGDFTPTVCEQLYDFAELAHGSLSPERMSAFITRSSNIMSELTQEK